MARTDVRLHGLDQLKKTLKQLPKEYGEKILRGGLRKGANIIRDEAQKDAPVLKQPVNHRRAGVVRERVVTRRSKKDLYGVFVGVKPLSKGKIKSFKKAGGSVGQNPDDPFYWVFSEFGTSLHPAAPFMRPAFESKKMDALNLITDTFKRRATAVAKKLAKQNGVPKPR